MAGCSQNPATSPEPDESPNPTETVSPAPDPSESPKPTTVIDTDWEKIYRDFIASGEGLTATLSQGIFAVGLADLDFDDVPELILYDIGASAAYGLSLFDINDEGEVVCVSGIIDYGVGEEPNIVLYGTGAEDFHLLELENGSRIFYYTSHNGSYDTAFKTHILFERGELLELVDYASVSEVYDVVNGTIISADYTVSGKTATEDEYDSAISALTHDAVELDYEVSIIFSDFDQTDLSIENALKLLDDAIEEFYPVD